MSDVMRDKLDNTLLQAVGTRDEAAARTILRDLATTDSTTAEWAESLGLRLQIRDALLSQKGDVAALQEGAWGDMEAAVRTCLGNMDQRVRTLEGRGTAGDTEETAEMLRRQRIGRLALESGDKLQSLLTDFSAQPVNRFVASGDLLGYMVDVRCEVVDNLWPAVQTYREGDVDVSRQELAQGLMMVNDTLDESIAGIVRWQS